ncbi:MAG: DsbA family protein [Phycisphaerales bacterium]
MPKPPRSNPPATASAHVSTARTPAAPVPTPAWTIALLALVGANIASGMLVADRLGWLGQGLPGCGPNSGCAKATASALGKLPFSIPSLGPTLQEGWPVSFLGFAFFAAMLATWLFVGRRVPSSVVHMARLGLLASGFYLVMMLTNMNQYLCKYCLASHACNLVFWVAAEVGTRAATRRAPGFVRAVATAAAVFFTSSIALAALDARAIEAKAQHQEDNLAAEIAAMQAELAADAAAAEQATPPPAPAPEAPKQVVYPPIDIGLPVPADDTLQKEGFTGRYRLGPAEAPIRVVVISDYQCKDCKRIENELRALLKERSDVSLSAKHFAFDMACNKMVDRTLHPNACWAARAAETAGILRGNAGFWQMHFWLFDRKTNGEDTPGSFTNQELMLGLKELGYPNPDEFVKIMNSPATLEPVQKDIEEAITYGLFSTPMIFVNGREFKAWGAPNAVKRYIEAVAANNPKPAPPTADKPAGAFEKATEDWRLSPRVPANRSTPMYRKGPDNARVRITVFGDFADDFTHRMWEEVAKHTKDRPDTAITFLPRPAKETCNVMNAKPEDQPACRMARALESAGRLGGPDAYWKMFDWLLANGRTWSESKLPEAAAAAGVDLKALSSDMVLDEVMFVLVENSKLFQRVGARGVPTVTINDRVVLRWKINETAIIDRIITEAANGR